MSVNEIRHEGIICAIEDNKIRVSILQKSACASCSVKGACSMSESVDKEVEIFDFDKQEWKIGEKVDVCMQQSMGSKAVLIAYVFPIVVLLISLIATLQITQDEVSAGMVALLSIAVYFSVVYLFKKRLNNTFKFTLKKK
jgi:sigma-E factor negative regulatory protein RseC